MPDLDAFLLYLRTGRGRAEATTEAYARDLAFFETWRTTSGRDLMGAARDPAALTKMDISSFLVGLRVAANGGRLPQNMHSRTLWFLRQFLRESRDLGLDERGGPPFGLARSVTAGLIADQQVTVTGARLRLVGDAADSDLGAP